MGERLRTWFFLTRSGVMTNLLNTTKELDDIVGIESDAYFIHLLVMDL